MSRGVVSTPDSPNLGKGSTLAQPASPDKKLRVIIIGGSIAGLSCARALLKSGKCKVMVIEKAKTLTSIKHGLGIDQLSCEALEDWGLRDKLFYASRPLDQEENRAVDMTRMETLKLIRDEFTRLRAVSWGDLHRILYDSLPPEVPYFGHEALYIKESEEQGSISVVVSDKEEGPGSRTKTVDGDLIVGADGAMSKLRQFYWPDESKRYSGYCAWKGLIDCSKDEELYAEVKQFYPEIGETLYFDIGRRSHVSLYELKGKMLTWSWYINQPEPVLEGDSLVLYPDENQLAALHRDASRAWMPALVNIIKKTPNPCMSVIYDKEPTNQVAWRRVVLVGEAAHPTTPHAFRSANLSIGDAYALQKAFEKYGPGDVNSALSEYESKRHESGVQQVLFSRHLGQLKQGLLFEKGSTHPWRNADEKLVKGLLLKNLDVYKD